MYVQTTSQKRFSIHKIIQTTSRHQKWKFVLAKHTKTLKPRYYSVLCANKQAKSTPADHQHMARFLASLFLLQHGLSVSEV